MRVLDEATNNGRKAGSVPHSVSTSQGAPIKLPNGVAKQTSAPLIDLLDLSSNDIPAASPSDGNFLQDLLGADLSPASSQRGANQIQKSGTDVLLDLLSIGTPPAPSSSPALDILSSGQNCKSSLDLLDKLVSPSANASSPLESSSVMNLLDSLGSNPSVPVAEGNGPTYPSIVAFESSSLKATFSFSKESGNPQTTVIEAKFINKSPTVYTNFLFQAAVPKFLQLQLEPASSNVLLASGNGSITQKLRVSTSQQGKKSLIMRIRISYKVNDKDILEEGQISNFPRDL